MKEENIVRLLDHLFSKKFKRRSYSGSEVFNVFVIEEEARNIVEDIIRNYIKEDHEEKIGILEAKVNIYEQIISKSNFAPLLIKQ